MHPTGNPRSGHQGVRSLMGRIRSTTRGSPAGRVFSPSDFLSFGGRAAVDQALVRLTRQGELRRVGRGLYDRPRRHPQLGVLLPSSDALAKALAAKSGLRLQPAGAHAANLLGLSLHVPQRIVFLTDGATRTVRAGEQRIELRHAAPRHMATAGRTSGLVIQALRHLGQKHVDDDVVQHLRRRLSPVERKSVAADARHAPAWIATVLRRLASEEK